MFCILSLLSTLSLCACIDGDHTFRKKYSPKCTANNSEDYFYLEGSTSSYLHCYWHCIYGTFKGTFPGGEGMRCDTHTHIRPFFNLLSFMPHRSVSNLSLYCDIQEVVLSMTPMYHDLLIIAVQGHFDTELQGMPHVEIRCFHG